MPNPLTLSTIEAALAARDAAVLKPWRLYAEEDRAAIEAFKRFAPEMIRWLVNEVKRLEEERDEYHQSLNALGVGYEALQNTLIQVQRECDALLAQVQKLEDESRQWEKASLVQLLAERDALRQQVRELDGK